MRAAFFLLLAVALQISATPTCRNCNPPFALNPGTGKCTECEFGDPPTRANFSKGCMDWNPNNPTDVAKLTGPEIVDLLTDHPKTFKYDRTIEQVQCYGRGDFSPVTKACTCRNSTTTGRFYSAGSYCQTCAPGYIGLTCSSKGCNQLNYCANGDAIVNGAVCDDRALRTQAACGNQVYDTTDDLCCKYTSAQFPFSIREVRQGAKADGSTCCGAETCTWSQTCESFDTLRFIPDTSNPVGGTYQTYSQQKCFDKTKKKKCEKMRYNVDTAKWYIYDVQAIEKWESCCGAESICGSNQACVEHATDALFPAQAMKGGDPNTVGYGSNDRLDWVRPPLKGQDPENKKTQVKVGKEDEGKVSFRKKCVAYKIRSGTAVYAGVLPAMLLLVTLIGAGLVISAAGTGSAKVFVPALLVILLSCTLYVTSAWASGLLAALGAFMAIGAQAGSSENKHVFSVIVQFFIFCALCGGMGLGILFSSGSQFFGTANFYNGNGAATACVNFYGYFNNNNNKPWNQEETYEQLCSRDWLSASLFFSAVLVAFFFLQLVASASLMAGDK